MAFLWGKFVLTLVKQKNIGNDLKGIAKINQDSQCFWNSFNIEKMDLSNYL